MKKQVIWLVILIILLAGISLLFTQNKPQKSQPSPNTISPTIAGVQFPLNINTPTDGEIVKSSNIIVTGATAPNAEVNINDRQVTADTKGNFSAAITLDEGENTIVVTTNDNIGNFSEKEMTVTYEP